MKLFFRLQFFLVLPLNILRGVFSIPDIFVLIVSSLPIIILFIGNSRNRIVEAINKYLIYIILLYISAYFSNDYITSFTYTSLFVLIIISANKLNTRDLTFIIQNDLKIFYLSVMMCVLLVFYEYGFNEAPTKNSLSLILACLILCYDKKNYFLLGTSLVAIYLLNSRSTVVLLIIILAIKHRKILIKNIFFLSPIIVASISVISVFFINFISSKSQTNSLTLALNEAFEERNLLVIQGWKLFKEQPWFGNGLGLNYWDGEIFGNDGITSYHVHNGILHELIQVGVFIVLFNLFYFLNALKFNLRDNFTFFILLFGLLRTYGESYFVLNFGNPFSILIILLIFSNANNKSRFNRFRWRN